MEDINKIIFKEGYGLQQYSGIRTRTGLICRTNVGFLELKKARVGKQNISFAHDVKEHLYKKGFSHLNRFRKTLTEEPYFEKEGILYVVEDVLPKESLAEKNIEEFLQGMETLGKMHFLGRGISKEFAIFEENKLEKKYEKRKNELGKIRGRIQKEGRYDAIDCMVMKVYEVSMEQAKNAQEFLKDGNYQDLANRVAEQSLFCHNTYKGDSLRQEKGVLYVGGFEYVNSDLPLQDVSNYLKRFLRKVGGGKEEIYQLLSVYCEENSMTKEEFICLKALAVYPEKFLKIINEHYNKRRCCRSSAMEEYLASVILQEEESRKLLAYLEWSIGKLL
ncbi:MAG: hypothetical protein R3Y53_10250 [Bacillota bacterium]